MDRRNFIFTTGASLAVSALNAPSEAHRQATKSKSYNTAPRPDRPNVVVIICDDLGYGDLGCYGSKIATPHLDRLARSGVRFTNYSTPHPICSAARAALMTGRYPTRVGTPGVFFPLSDEGMSLDASTIANVLQNIGYRTMAIGKWHLGDLKPYLPTSRGFDGFYGVPYSVDMDPLPLLRDTHILEPEANRDALTQQYTKQAVEFVNESSDKPFLLYLAHSYPHIPLHASSKFRGKSNCGLYGDVLQEIDWSVGEVVHALQRNGIERKTLIVFTSDHGPWFQGSTGDLRGRKGNTYEGGLRVPLIASMPGVLPENETSNAFGSHMDLFPTITTLCGGKLPAETIDGHDIWTLLTLEQSEINRKPFLSFAGWNVQCARWNKWKLHVARSNVPSFLPAPAGGRFDMRLRNPELYDLDEDPKESYDIASEHPEIVAAIQRGIVEQLATFPEQVQKAYRASEQHLANNWMPADAYSPDFSNSEPGVGAWLQGSKAEQVLRRFE